MQEKKSTRYIRDGARSSCTHSTRPRQPLRRGPTLCYRMQQLESLRRSTPNAAIGGTISVNALFVLPISSTNPIHTSKVASQLTRGSVNDLTLGAHKSNTGRQSELQLIMAQGVGGGVCGRRAHLLLVGERVLAGELLDGVGLRCRGSLVRAAADARR